MISKEQFINDVKDVFVSNETAHAATYSSGDPIEAEISWDIKRIDYHLGEIYDYFKDIIDSEIAGLSKRIGRLEMGMKR
jgi:hypothetical protein